MFANNLINYMPRYNELKYFNATKIASNFLQAKNLKFNQTNNTTFSSN